MIEENSKINKKQLILHHVRDAYFYGKESGLYLGFIFGYLTGIVSGYSIFYFRRNMIPEFLKK
tara:strand:+ start:1218 stop:1406 length:189 start_codon:yes stop_codon:yes gene_type:complete